MIRSTKTHILMTGVTDYVKILQLWVSSWHWTMSFSNFVEDHTLMTTEEFELCTPCILSNWVDSACQNSLTYNKNSWFMLGYFSIKSSYDVELCCARILLRITWNCWHLAYSMVNQPTGLGTPNLLNLLGLMAYNVGPRISNKVKKSCNIG